MKLRFTEPKRDLRGARRIIISATSVRKAKDDEILDKLSGFLDEQAPKLALFLYRLYKDQQNAITYAELRNAIINGYIEPKTLHEWQEDYARFVEKYLKPTWTKAIEAAAEEKANNFVFDPMSKTVQDWINANGARWVTNQTETVKDALRTIIGNSVSEKYSADELARCMRPLIGLTKPQAAANIRYYTNMKEKLAANHPRMKAENIERRAKEAAEKYAGKQLRTRADTIAQTEVAFAYARGAEEVIKQAQEQGLMGTMARRWVTAKVGVCEICAALDGKLIAMDESYDIPGMELFEGMHQTPPAHPRCRCAVEYVEVKPETAGATETLTILPDDTRQNTQNYKPVETADESTDIQRNGDKIVTHRLTSAVNDMYVSESVKLKPKQMHNIDANVTKVKKLLEVGENDKLPNIYIISSAEMSSNALASYNPIKNAMYFDAKIGNKDDMLKLQEQFAANGNETSTYLHEFLHWQDAREYIKKNGEFTSAADYERYIAALNKKCKIKLDKLEKEGYNIDVISEYASKSIEDENYIEVYTEYRVKNRLER